MSKAKKNEGDTQALTVLSRHFVSYMMEEGTKGDKLECIVSRFSRHQSKIFGGLIGSAGVAGGTWAAVSMWSCTLGAWGKLAFAAGLFGARLWVPVAGSVAGLTAAGGGVIAYLSVSRNRGKKRQLQSIIGFSKLFLNVDGPGFSEEDNRLMRRFLLAKKVREESIEELLATSPQTAIGLAGDLPASERREIARYVFPLVYTGDGVISDVNRRRFRRVCMQLQLVVEVYRSISEDYRKRLDSQWSFLRNMILHLNYFAHALGFDSREMEMLREQLELLMGFDPQRSASEERIKTLALLGGKAIESALSQDDEMGEAACMGAYSLAQTVTQGNNGRLRLGDIFDGLIDRQNKLAPE